MVLVGVSVDAVMLGGGMIKVKAAETTRRFSPPLIRMMIDRSASLGSTSGKGENSPVKSHCSPIILG